MPVVKIKARNLVQKILGVALAAMTLGAVPLSSAKADMTELDRYTYSHCMVIPEIASYMQRYNQASASDRMMSRLVFGPMEMHAAKIGKSPDIFFTHPFCEPRYLGGAFVPYIHLIADNTTDRLPIIEAVGKYYRDTKERPGVWLSIVNAKNTRGMTVLDYVEYVLTQHRNIAAEAPGIAAFVSFICANGGVYSMFQKRCPPAREDTAEGILSRIQRPDNGRREAANALLRNQPDTRDPKDR